MDELTQYLLWSAFFTALTIVFLRRRSTRELTLLPPGPRPLPLLGNLLELGQNPHRSLARLARTHGPVMSLKLGSIHTVVISSPSSAKEALKTKEHSISGRQVPHAIQASGHHKVSLVWLPPNQSWRYLRTLMKTHLLNTQSLNETQLLRRQKVQELVAYVKGKKNEEAVHIARAAFCTVLNLISNTFLSIDMVDFKSESAQELKDMMQGIMEEAGKPNLSDFFSFLAPFDLQGRGRRFTEYFNKLSDFFDQIIENRLAAMTGEGKRTTNPDVLDVLLQLSREDNSKLTRRTIKSFLLDSFVAGSETSSTTLEWAMAELLRRPEMMKRAREEIITVVGNREIEESDISKLPFLQAILKETLRIHPPIPLLLPHKAEASTEINGYTVPKNTQVLVNVWAIGRDGRVWENPDWFMPERFMEGSKDIDFRGQYFELIPFGSGRRICPGLPLGVRMVQLMLASLIQSFEWSLPDGMKPKDLNLDEQFGLTLSLSSPLKALATPVKIEKLCQTKL